MIAREEPPPFAIAQRDGEVILSGELDLAAKADLHDCLDALDATRGELVIDLTAVSFIDSSGIEALCSTRRRLAGDGGVVVLRRPTSVVMRALEVTGVASLFRIDVDDGPDGKPSSGAG